MNKYSLKMNKFIYIIGFKKLIIIFYAIIAIHIIDNIRIFIFQSIHFALKFDTQIVLINKEPKKNCKRIIYFCKKFDEFLYQIIFR